MRRDGGRRWSALLKTAVPVACRSDGDRWGIMSLMDTPHRRSPGTTQIRPLAFILCTQGFVGALAHLPNCAPKLRCPTAKSQARMALTVVCKTAVWVHVGWVHVV